MTLPGGGALAQTSKTATQADEKGDVAGGGLDLTRVSLGRASDGRLRASLTLAESWEASDLEASTGPPGSICLRIWTVAEAPDNPPDFLICVTAAGEDELRASVLQGAAQPAATAGRQRGDLAVFGPFSDAALLADRSSGARRS